MLTFLSLNCASIDAKFDQLTIKLQQLKNNGVDITAICIQETWLANNSDTSILQINDYNLISQGKICSAHGGLLIYLNKKLSYEILHINNVSTIWECQFIEITLNVLNKKIILGNVYRPPHDTNVKSAEASGPTS